MILSSSSGLLATFNDIINSLMYVETFEILAERTTEIIMQLPNIKQVTIHFEANNIQKTKITEKLISLPLNGNGQTYGRIDIEGTKPNFASIELINLLEMIGNISAAIYGQIKRSSEYKILSNIAKETDYAIVITDYLGKIEWVNDGFVTLSEYTLDEVKGLRPSDILQGIDTDFEKVKMLASAIKHQEEIEFEVVNYTKSGKKYHVNLEIKPLFENGQLTHYISIQKNITKIKQVEEELRQNKEIAEAANEAKNRFLAITSHEIRTPLNIILGMSKILLETDITETQHKYLRGIKSSSQNLLLIINDLLDISKIEAGKLQLENIEFNFHQVAEDAMTFQNIKAKEKGIELIIKKDESVDDCLLGDPFRLNQIFLNLLTNALKFTEKGSITLSYSLVSENEIENTIKIEIIDTGIGIDSKKINSIFESFTQEDLSITRKYGGTGLGLTITKQLVDLFEGNISVSSDKTKGTIFTLFFTFKKALNKSKIEPDKATQQDDLKGIKILLAEDNELNQIIALTYLNRWGIITDTVINGIEAVEKTKVNDYDVILMDIQMPDMNGIEATKIIRNQLHKKTPIIALTAHALNNEKEEYMNQGLSDYITKPIDEILLYNSIVKHIKKGVEITSGISKVKEKPLNDKIYNLEELKKISISDVEFIPKILKLFIKQSADIPEKLSSLILTKSIAEIGYTIHQIKPSLHHLSVECTKDIISKIEDNIHQKINDEETVTLTLQLIGILNILMEQLQKELENFNSQ